MLSTPQAALQERYFYSFLFFLKINTLKLRKLLKLTLRHRIAIGAPGRG